MERPSLSPHLVALPCTSLYQASTGWRTTIIGRQERDAVGLGQLVHATCRKAGAAVLFDPVEDIAFAGAVYEGDGVLRPMRGDEERRMRTARGWKQALVALLKETCKAAAPLFKEEAEG